VKEKNGWIFVEYNGVSFVGGNCKKSPMSIMLIPPNGKMLYFNLCSFKCNVASKVQPTIDISSIMINYIYGHKSIIEVGLFTLACFSIDNSNKTWIVVMFINRLHLMYMPQLLIFVYFLYLKNNFGPL